jgi:hypothetical protein
LITNVVTTHAAVADSAMTMPIHTMLTDRDLLPAEHLMDAGYPSTANLLTLRTEHQVRLIAPMRGDSSRHAREGSPYARDKFTIDFDQQQATCPQGNQSATWNPARQDGQDVIVVSFPLGACIVCLARTECTRSQQRRRQLTLRPRHLHEALRDARAEQQTDAWKQTYRARAGIEGTIHQTTTVTGIRQARYRPAQSHPRTRLRRDRDQPHPPLRLVDRHTHTTHPNNPPQQTRSHPRRIDRIRQRSPADAENLIHPGRGPFDPG